MAKITIEVPDKLLNELVESLGYPEEVPDPKHDPDSDEAAKMVANPQKPDAFLSEFFQKVCADNVVAYRVRQDEAARASEVSSVHESFGVSV